MDPVSMIDKALADNGLSEDEPFRQLLRNAVPFIVGAIQEMRGDAEPEQPVQPDLVIEPPPRGTPEYDYYANIPVFLIYRG